MTKKTTPADAPTVALGPPPDFRRMVVPHPARLPPDAETHVPCPACKQGMVPASTARVLAERLGDAHPRSEPGAPET